MADEEPDEPFFGLFGNPRECLVCSVRDSTVTASVGGTGNGFSFLRPFDDTSEVAKEEELVKASEWECECFVDLELAVPNGEIRIGVVATRFRKNPFFFFACARESPELEVVIDDGPGDEYELRMECEGSNRSCRTKVTTIVASAAISRARDLEGGSVVKDIEYGIAMSREKVLG